ncbi:neutral zinc metallopeptidase [Nakamurella sp.]|uniref:neutral zinc metallopeptidase n=1 Tax=Nakamurella sp. TaxID=1869182 RepID=UPI003784E4D6
MSTDSGRGPARWVALALAGLVMALSVTLVVAAATATGRGGSAVATERIDTTSGGVPIAVAGSFGTAAAAGDPLDPFTSSADGDRVVSAVLADLSDYWTATIDAAGGTALRSPTGGFVSMDSAAPAGSSGSSGGGALCIADPAQIAGNAFYCPAQDGIVFDSAALVPVLLGSYGSGGLAASFAHEFGHAVQAQVGPTPADRRADPDRYPALLIEAQADCAAGAFLAAASAGTTARVHLPVASLTRAVAPLLDFRDRATVAPGDPTAHGLALDRLNSVLHGFRAGGLACWAMTTADLSPTLGRAGVLTDPPVTPRYGTTAAALDAAAASVSAFAGTPPAAPDPTDVERAVTIGQFAAGAAVARATGRAAADDDVAAACFTGAWTASVFGSAPAGSLGSWAGDADEALDLVRSRPGASFAELAAYADGFHGGRAACS